MKETIKLNNGVEMPILGFGVYQVVDRQQCRESVLSALESGYRLLDTASVYGNEEAVGEAIRDSGVRREEIFLTTKAWINELGEEQTLRAFDRSCRRLGLESIDLYLIHMPFGDVHGAWRAIERLYQEGRVRAVGVCNFSRVALIDLMSHFELRPAVNQVETHLLHQQKLMQAFCRRYEIGLEAWSPFAEGRCDYFRQPLLVQLAEKYHATPAQVALVWLRQRGIVAIPKSVHRQRIQENYRSLRLQLDEEDMALLSYLDRQVPLVGDFEDSDFVAALCSQTTD